MACQRKSCQDIGGIGNRSPLARAKKSRQHQQSIRMRASCVARHGTAAARADMGQILIRSGNSATREVEAEAERREDADLPADQDRGGERAVERWQKGAGRGEKFGMRYAFRQGEIKQLERCRPDREPLGILKKLRRLGRDQLAGEMAEVFRQARAPTGLNQHPGLQRRREAPSGATPDDAKMPAMITGEHGRQGVGLAEATPR